MSGPTDPLALGATTTFADSACRRYKTWLLSLLIIEAAAGVSLLLSPITITRMLGFVEGGGQWARLAGLMILFVVALLYIGRGFPDRAKVTNLIGMIGRAIVGLALILLGGGLVWAGLVELVGAIGLAALYYGFFSAEIMSRP